MKVLGALTVSLVTLQDGVLRGFPTVALPHLELSENEGSWFAAISWTSGIVFTPLGGAISGWLGRKKTLLLFSPIVSLGWLLIAISKANFYLFLGRTLASVATYAMLATPSNTVESGIHCTVRNDLPDKQKFKVLDLL